MAEEPGPAWPGSGAAGRARASAGGKLHGCGGHGQERWIAMALTVAGFCGWGDEDRQGGGGGCLRSGILLGDRYSWGASCVMDTPLGLQSSWYSIRKEKE